jgi:hypothetical protein
LAGIFPNAHAAPVLPLEEIAPRFRRTILSGGDIRTLLQDVEFQQIEDRNSQMLFLRRFVVDECLVSMNTKMPADVYDISVGNVKNSLRCRSVARSRSW